MIRLLIVAAHPDDEILGCGGTIAKMIEDGHEAFTLILGEGITSRDNQRNRKNRENDINELKNQTNKSNEIIGIKKVFSYNFQDNRFDTSSLLNIVKIIEKIKNKVKPNIIFTHYYNDLNIDHKITYNAVITATRPLNEETVKEIYAFEILSSTEWNYPLNFSPNVFFDISSTIHKKIKAMSCYKSEIRKFPHPRSLENIKLNAKMWGIKVGLEYVEAFQLIRSIRK